MGLVKLSSKFRDYCRVQKFKTTLIKVKVML